MTAIHTKSLSILLLAICVVLLAAPGAWAFIPPPIVPGTGVGGGEVNPPPPPPVDPFPQPPSPPAVVPTPPAVPGTPHNTPEPTTLVSGLIGLSMLGGYVLRRRFKK